MFDANVLLNLYRYSESTREQLLSVLSSLGDRVWLPHQAAEEFLVHRLDVIHAKNKDYLDLHSAIKEAQNEIELQMQQLHRDSVVEAKSLLEDTQASISKLLNHLEERQQKLPRTGNSPEEDGVWQVLDGIFIGKVGTDYSKDRKAEIFQEGHERYENKIPPGYKDASKDGGGGESASDNSERRFGDLILWHQTIDKAIEMQSPMVLVTDDRKEDWWQISHGMTVGPRLELIREMRERAGVPFYMYRPDRLVSEASDRGLVGGEISGEVIDEIQDLDQVEMDSLGFTYTPAPQSQVDFVRVLADEVWGQHGTIMLERALGRPISKMTRAEAEEWIDYLTPDPDDDFRHLPASQYEWTPEMLDSAPYPALRGNQVPLKLYVVRVLGDLRSGDFEKQNKAADALMRLSSRQLAEVDTATQERLGRAVLAAAGGPSSFGSFGAQKLLKQASALITWPPAFIRGLLLEALVSETGYFSLRDDYLQQVTLIALSHPRSTEIVAQVTSRIRKSKADNDSHTLRLGRGDIIQHDAAVATLEELKAHSPEDTLLLGKLIDAVNAAKP